jgi:hypothetical protein
MFPGVWKLTPECQAVLRRLDFDDCDLADVEERLAREVRFPVPWSRLAFSRDIGEAHDLKHNRITKNLYGGKMLNLADDDFADVHDAGDTNRFAEQSV